MSSWGQQREQSVGRVAGVLDDPPGFPFTPPGVDVLEGGKLISNNVAGSSHDPLQSFAVASGAVYKPERCIENPVSSMAESGTIADIQVSVRQITQQSLVSCWYEMRACSSQSLLSSDWTLASKMVGRGGWKPHVSVWWGRQLSSLFFGYVSFVVVVRAMRPRQRALMQCLWIEHQHSRTQNPVCILRWRNQCLKACVYRRQLY